MLVAACLALLTFGCGPDDGARDRNPDPGATGSGSEGETLLPSGADSAGAGASRGSGSVCLQGGPFAAQGPVPVRGWLAATITGVTALRWEQHEGCGRFVIDLGEGGMSGEGGGAGEARVAVLRDVGVVRVTLPGIRSVDPDATDATLGGPLARAAYVVWAPDEGSTWIDIHLDGPAEASAIALDDPARVVVDLRPGGDPLGGAPTTGRHVVVLEPGPGEASYPLHVRGYARTFEANVVARLEQDGRQAPEKFTTATAWVDAWGHFELTLEGGPTGAVLLHVGEYSARDGSWEGVAIDLVVR